MRKSNISLANQFKNSNLFTDIAKFEGLYKGDVNWR